MFTLEAPALLFLAFGSVPALAAGGLEPTVACVKNGTLADDDFFLQTRGGFAANPEIGTSWKQHAQCAPTEVSLDRTGSKHMWALQWGRAFLFDGDSTQCNSQWTSLPPAPTNLTTISGSGTAAFVADVNRKVYQLIGASVSNPGGTAWAEMSLPAAGTATALALSSDQRLFVAADHQNEKVGATTSLFQASSSDNYSTFEILNPQPPESIGDIIHLAANSNQLVGLGDTGIIAKFSLSARKASSPGWITLNNVSTPLASVDIDSEGTIWGSTPEGAVLHLPAGASQAEWKIVSKPSELVCIRITASATLAPNSLLPRPSLLSPISGFLNPVRLATSATIVDSSTIPSDVVKDASARYAKLLGLTAADAPNKHVRSARSAAQASIDDISQIKIVVEAAANSPAISLETDESYTLLVQAPQTQIQAATAFGALRGLETLSQYLENGAVVAAVNISDTPRFQYRGLMVDPARRFLPISSLHAVIDSMSYAKLNVLHVHMTDDQSWPMQSQTFPELAQKGAFSFPSHTYNTTQLRDLVEYARLHGIRVVLEVDTPGHSAILGLAKPEVLTYCPGSAPYGLDFSNLDPTRNSTFEYLRALFREAVTIFPDKYVFLGGDEVSTACWASNATVVAWLKAQGMPADASTLQAYFEKELVGIVRNDPTIAKEVIVWQEVFQTATDPIDTLGQTAVVSVWKGTGAEDVLADVTSAGLRAVVSYCWYLDIVDGSTAWGRQWLEYYACEPQNFNGSDAQKDLVIGGHACIWGEACDASNLLPRVWPRLAATAERLWTRQELAQDTTDFARRLHAHRCRLLRRGIAASPVGTLGDPAVPSELTIGPGSRTYCEEDVDWEYPASGF